MGGDDGRPARALGRVSWSGAKIRVKVPRGSPKGAVNLTVRTSCGTSAARRFVRL